MQMIRTISVSCCCASVLLACAKPESQGAADTSAAASAAATATPSTTTPAPAPISLADVAGKWQMRSVPESGSDTSATLYVLTATNNTDGWTLVFPGRPAIPVRVTIAGDSIITDVGPYPSVRRKGVTVTTNGTMRMQNGKLVGTTVAHYKTNGPDSVLRLRTEGTRAP